MSLMNPHLVKPRQQNTKVWRLSLGFFLLGLLNNVLYVIILSAALDLVPADVPKGVILFANIFPALCVKIGWPYFVPGRVRYGRRVIGCSLLSFMGILLVAATNSLQPRLFGIALASFSSGLGEMTYLQRSTCYGNETVSKAAVGWFSSGTGAAGLVGAGLWWELRGLGVKAGCGLSSILPILMGIAYFALIPGSSAFRTDKFTGPVEEDEAVRDRPMQEEAADDTAPLIARSQDREEFVGNIDTAVKPQFSSKEKLDLALPLFLPFMVPLFVVYFAEYTVNTGVSPTLLYPVPNKNDHWILASVITKLSDYYPLWQLIYQTFVFFSRSSMVIFQIPPLPRWALPLPSAAQACVLLIAVSESMHGAFTWLFGPAYAIIACACLVAVEGLSGGLSYGNMYYHVGLIPEKEDNVDTKTTLARREFRIACVGFADTLGILAASLVSLWLEPTLCSYQISTGRTLCKQVK